jgi:hypothetical protein
VSAPAAEVAAPPRRRPDGGGRRSPRLRHFRYPACQHGGQALRDTAPSRGAIVGRHHEPHRRVSDRIWGERQVHISLYLLFGLRFAIVQQRAADRNLPIASIRARRLLVLLGIGLVHGLGIWYGDILVSYAVAGGLLLLFRRCRPRTLLIWGILLNLLSFVQLEVETYWSVGATLQRGAGSELPRPAERPTAQSAAAEAAIAAYGHGTFSASMRQRADDFWIRHQEIQNTILRRLSLFLFGLFVGRIGLVRALPQYRTARLRALRWALAVGVLAHHGARCPLPSPAPGADPPPTTADLHHREPGVGVRVRDRDHPALPGRRVEAAVAGLGAGGSNRREQLPASVCHLDHNLLQLRVRALRQGRARGWHGLVCSHLRGPGSGK